MSDDQDITEQTSKARAIVDALLERDQAEWRNILSRRMHFDNYEEDIANAARQPFTALDYALTYGHHYLLWNAVKGSVYEREYRKHFNVDESGPKLKTLKDHRVDLDPKERKEVVRRGAVWDEGRPGVWKSVVNGKTWYVSNTHRAYRVKPTLRGAIQAFSYVKTTA